jgi:hypothetical protein
MKVITTTKKLLWQLSFKTLYACQTDFYDVEGKRTHCHNFSVHEYRSTRLCSECHVSLKPFWEAFGFSKGNA